MAYYVFDDAKNLFEGMTKEQIVNAIASATGLTPEQIDADVITSAIKEQNAQKSVNLWVGTQNEYNAIATPDENTLYIVTDPHETNELQSQINQLQSEIDNIVAASTTNASGYIIEKLESDPQPLVYNSTYQWYEVANNFVVPEDAEILEYCWKRAEADNHTNDIYASRDSDTVVKVVYHSDAQEVGNFILSLVISYPQPITLPELTDIRVGYDGTVYESAGEAVRKQAFETRFHDYIKQALLNLLAHVAYTDQNGQQYYNALERAMYMTAGVTSITAVFEQGENVIYDTDDLETLRQYLTVTAYFEDNTSEVITAYSLSGTLTVGTSTITVSFAGKTTTFNAIITESPVPSGYTMYDYLKRSSASNDWIQTSLVHSPSFAVLDCEFWFSTNNSSGTTAAVFGCRTGNSASTNKNEVAVYACDSAKNAAIRSGTFGTPNQDFGSYQANTLRHVVYKYNNGNSYYIVDNGNPVYITNAVTSDNITAQTKYGLWLLGINAGGSAQTGSDIYKENTTKFGKIIFYYAGTNQKAYEFIPVYNGTKYGYYETVNGVFYPQKNNILEGGNY